MKQAIILHGRPGREEYYDPKVPSASNSHWLPWLQKQLLIRDITGVTPEIPNSYEPNYADWMREIERFDLTPSTAVVGHSCGAGFWLRYLSEHSKLKLDSVYLVAPSLGLDWDDKSFFAFKLDEKITNRVRRLVILYSDDDRQGILDAVDQIFDALPTAIVRHVAKQGHFTYESMGKHEFPELLEEMLK